MSTTVSSSRPTEGNLVVALSVQEMFLVVRAEDRASNTMRKISKSISSMGEATAAATAEQKFANAQNVLANKLGAQRGKLATQTEAQGKAMTKYSNALAKAQMAEQDLARATASRGAQEARMQNARRKFTAITPPQRAMLGQGAAAQAEIAAAEKQLQATVAEEVKLTAAADKATASLAREEAAVASLAKAMGATRGEIAATVASMRELATEQARMAPIMARADRGARRKGLGGAISGMGNQAVFAGGAGLAIAGLAANSAANLQRSTTLAATQASRSSAGIAAKAHQAFQVVLKQMGQFPAKAEDMSASLYDIFSSTNIQSISKGAKMLTTLNKAAVAGQTDLQTATDASISIMNAFAIPVNKLTPTMDKMFAAVRYGRMTFSQFGGSLNTIVPAFRGAHQSLDTMLGSLAFLTRRMPSVNAAAVSLARSVEVLGNQKLDAKFKKWGMPITDNLGRLKPLDQVIGTILKKFPALAKGKNVMGWLKDMTNQQGTIQARRALQHIFLSFGDFKDILHKTSSDVGEFNRSYTALKDTPANKLAVAMGKLRAAWLNFGDSAIPMVTDLMNKLTQFVGAFTRVNNATHGALGEIVAWGSLMTLGVGLGMKFVGMLFKIAGAFDAIAASKAAASLTGGKGIFGRAAAKGGGIPEAFVPPVAAGEGLAGAEATAAGASGIATALSAVAVAAPLAAVALAGWFSTMKKNPITGSTQLGSGHPWYDVWSGSDAFKQMDNFKKTHGLNFQRGQQFGTRGLNAVTRDAKLNTTDPASMQRDIAFMNKAAGSIGKPYAALQGRIDSLNKSLRQNQAIVAKGGGGLAENQAAKNILTIEKQITDERKKRGLLDSAAVNNIQKLGDGYTKLLEHGVNPASLAMKQMAMNIERMILGVANLGPKTGKIGRMLTGLTGRPVTIPEIQRFNTYKGMQPGMKEFAKTTHYLPGNAAMKVMIDNKPAQLSLAALMAHIGKLKPKQIKLLAKVPPGAQKALANLIDKIKKMPSKKQINIVVNNADKAKKQAKALHDQILKVSRMKLTNLFSGGAKSPALDQAKKKLAQMQGQAKKKTTSVVGLEYKPGYGQFTSKAKALGPTMKAAGVAAGTGLGDGLKAGMDSTTTEVQASAAALGNAATTALKNAKEVQVKSPSKVWMKIGVFLMEGLVQGIAKKKPDLIDQIKTVAQGAASAFDDIKSNMQGAFGDLFQGTASNTKLQDALTTANPWTGKTPTSTTFKAVSGDLKAQLYRFKMWQRALNRLRSRGIPGALYQQLLAAGPDSLPMVQALANSSGKQLKTYNKMFKQEQGMIGAASKAAFGVQTKMWKSMGQNVAFGFLAGLRQETPAITKYIHNMMLNLFGTAKKANKSHSPSKLWMSEGKNMLDGLQMGMSSYEPSFAPVGRGNAGGAGSGGDTHFHFAPTIYGNDYQSGLNKARFDFQQHVSRKLPR